MMDLPKIKTYQIYKVILKQMNMEQPQMDFEQEEYQSTYSSSEVDTYRELLLTSSDDKLIEMISRLKNDNEKFAVLFTELKEYASKKKDSVHLKKLENRVIQLMVNLKQNGRYAQTESQKNILWFFDKVLCNEKIIGVTQQTQDTFAKIFCDFLSFDDFAPLLKLGKDIYLNTKVKNLTFPFSERLNYLYHENYEKLQSLDTGLKFAQTMKNLDEESKLIVRTEIISFLSNDNSRWKIQESEIQKILTILSQRPYEKLFQTVVQKKLKSVKQLRSSILKSKIQIVDDRAELVFGAKCQLANQLKTKEIFQLTGKKCDGGELIPDMDVDSVILHGNYLFTKWSSEVIISAKDKVTYDSTEQQLNDGFLKLLSFLKKIFQHRHKHIQFVGSPSKMIEESSHDQVPQETVEYICHTLQLFIKFLSFNSLEINHRSHNLSELIPIAFLDEIFVFFEDELKKVQQISQEQEKKEKQEKKPKNIVTQTIDYVITFAAHLFYRRDFQSITALTSKTSQILIRILLLIENFPNRWTVLRNYKLVIDRWGESVDEGSEDYKKLARKFLDAYFNDKVTVYSKSSSTVFNPIFITRPYCKIFGSEFLKCIENFEKSLDDLDCKAQTGVSRQMNSKMSKIILFMSARVRFQDANKIAEHLSRIYRKYAHIIPEIYLFRSWISQMNLSKVTQGQMSVKLAECLDFVKTVSEKIENISAKKLMTPVSGLNEQQNAQVLKLLNLYKTCHYRALNSLQLKPKTEQFGSAIYQTFWQITKRHIDLQFDLKKKIREFESTNKEQYEVMREQNQLLLLNNKGSIYTTVEEIKSNLLSLVRYFICNAEKILSPKDYSLIVGIVAKWMRENVMHAEQDKQKFLHALKCFNIIFGSKLPAGFQSHLMKKQILGAMRALNGGEQLDLTRSIQIPFNEVSSLYEQIKPVYDKFIKLLFQHELNQNPSKDEQELYDVCRQVLEYIILPHTNILGPCNFNGKIQEKSTQDMVLGLFFDQADTIFKNFTVQDLLKLQNQYSLSTMLEITKNKQSKISEQKGPRANQGGIFAGGRSNRGRNQAIEELRQIHIPQDYIQIAFENIQVPDAQLALEWIQNNQERIETLIIEKALKESKQQLVMKPSSQPKIEIGKVTPLKYPQFIDSLEKSMKNLVKGLAKEMFSQDGKKIAKVLFIVLDAFKEEYRKKQYQNFAKKIFDEINGLNGKDKFDDKKYRLILRILNFIMKKETQVFNDYFKDGICLKVLSFVSSFANGFTNEAEKQKQRKQDLYHLLQIINKTLPEWKSPPKQIKPELSSYLNCLLDLIALSNLGCKDLWEILYKISLLQQDELRQKIVKLFSKIVLSNQILEEERQRSKEKEKKYEKLMKNSPIKNFNKTPATKIFMLPLLKLLLQQDKTLLTANIELQIKGYIAEEYKYEFEAKSQTKQETKQPLEIDLKNFSTSFDKFVGCPQFDNIFKKLFSKKKNKKNTLFYDFVKHPLFESEFTNESISQSFISLKYDVLVEQILKTMISRPLQFNDSERQLQQEALIELYKFLDYFKVLIPTALRTQWWNETQNKKENLLKWLVCKSVASNQKKFHFMTFLSMNNHLFVGEKQSISDWVCNEYLQIFRRQICQFGSKVEKMRENQQNEKNFKEESVDEIRFKKIMLNFMYLLPVSKFNSQCFLKTNEDSSVRDLVQGLFIKISPLRMPLLYTILSETIFILRKREMLELLKSKYQLHCLESNLQNNQSNNLNRGQFLSMSLIYKVDPGKLGDKSQGLKASKKRNIFSGSSGRIVVDEVDDDEDDEINLDEMEAQGDQYDSITNLLRMRYRQGQGRGQRVEGMEESFLHPILSNQPQQQAVVQQVQVHSQIEQEGHQPQSNIQKIEQEPKEIQKQQAISKFDYEMTLKQQAEKLIETLNMLEKLLPQIRSLQLKRSLIEKVQIHQSSEMVSEEQSRKDPYSLSLSSFTESLSILIHQVSTRTSLILLQNSRFDSNTQIHPEFVCRLALKDNIPKLVKFEKRFTSFITTLCPNITSSIWEKDYTNTSASYGNSSGQSRQMPSARWLLSRLQRQDSGQNRDEVIYHIERLINQRRQESRQQNVRPRVLNLTQAFQALPEQPEPPKVEQKPKQQQKPQQNKPSSSEKVEIKPEISESQPNKIGELPVVEIMSQQKAEQPQSQVQEKKEQKMQEEKPVQSVQNKAQEKVEEKPEVKPQQIENKMIPEEQQAISEVQQPIIPEQPQVIQQEGEIELPQEFMNQPQQIGSYRQVLSMFGLAQTFLADNGIDPEFFDSLPEELQIDQITHYINQAQNRTAINQLNQANQPQQQPNNPQQPGQNQPNQPAQQQGGNSVNEVLQQNIALFASMDPQTRMQMLADYPPEFLMQLPVQMRTEIEQYRQRQVNRFVEEEDEENPRGWREELQNLVVRKKDAKKDLKKENVKYPSPSELNFNPISQSLAEHLAQSIYLKIERTRVLEGFRLLLQNYLTQEGAIATIVGILRLEDGIKSIQLEYKSQQNAKKGEPKKQIPTEQKGQWRCEVSNLSNAQQISNIKEGLLNLLLQTLNQSVYKNEQFLMKKVSYQNYLHLKIEPLAQLEADESGFWPLYELLPYSLELSPKLTVQILKRVKQIPLRLIKDIVKAIRGDKLTPEIYKSLQFLSKNEDMKRLFMEQFPQERPLKLETFAKIIKYEFAKVPYLKKLHQEALNFYSAQYNEFLNQIFGIYSVEDIKEIQSILVKHKHVHFQVIKYLYSQNRVLDKEPIGLILKMPHLLDFETKKYLFRKHPKIRRASRYRLPIEVSRTNILQQSFNQIMSKTPKQLEGRLQITFMDQQGYDAGGLTREWLLCLSREIFNPNYALFEPSSSGNTYQPNPKSYINPDHLQYYKFIGRFVGKALAQNELVDAYFTRAFYKMVLGQQIELSDLQQQDYSFYKSMLWLKQNTIEQGEYTFSYLYDNFGQRIIKDLIPGGREINVTQQNKLQYIEKYCLAKMRDDFKVQIEKFLEGFHQIVPHECINFFEAKQLQLLISGLPEINFDDLKNNVDYSGFSPADQAIKWFWQILEEFTQEDLARLIQFITGTSKIPVDGFANIKGMNGPQRISIHKDPNSHQLPKAHTCFNQLDLPNYDSKEIMRQRIVTAITWGSEGFGFM